MGSVYLKEGSIVALEMTSRAFIIGTVPYAQFLSEEGKAISLSDTVYVTLSCIGDAMVVNDCVKESDRLGLVFDRIPSLLSYNFKDIVRCDLPSKEMIELYKDMMEDARDA